MSTCMICHFGTEMDDVVVRGRGGRCVCLRCYARETAGDRPMPKPLQRQVIALLAALEVG